LKNGTKRRAADTFCINHGLNKMEPNMTRRSILSVDIFGKSAESNFSRKLTGL